MSANTSAASTDTSSVSTTTTPIATGPQTDSVTAQIKPTSSYANVVQKDSNDNNNTKSGKFTDDTVKKSTVDHLPSASTSSNNNNNNNSNVNKNLDKKHDKETTATIQQSHTNDLTAISKDSNSDEPDIDDESFTRVVSHNKKDRNSRRKELQRKETGPSTNSNSSNAKSSNNKQRQQRSENGRSKDTNHRRSKGNRDDHHKDKSNAQSDGNSNASSDNNNTSTKNSSTISNNEASDEHAGNASGSANLSNDSAAAAAAKKFVEAPLPKVNAWKVSTRFSFVLICKDLLLFEFHSNTVEASQVFMAGFDHFWNIDKGMRGVSLSLYWKVDYSVSLASIQKSRHF